MAKRRVLSTAAKIFGLLILVIALFVGGVLWFDYIDLINANEILDPVLGPVLELVGLRQKEEVIDVEDPLLLERERMSKQMEAMGLMEDELLQLEKDLGTREAELNQIADQLADRESALEDREKSLIERQNAFETREDSLEQKARYLTGMPPENAVAILLQYDNDRDILDLFRVTDQLAQQAGEDSLVAYWLSKMPADRGAELTRKMSQGLP